MDDSYEILLVDDVSENIKVAINILQSENYNFSYALSGEEAIKILKLKRFDLVLLDIMMPGVDGFRVCEIIKKSPSIADTPVIFLTAKTDIDSVEKGFNLGAVDYVTKPFHAIELKSRVSNHLELYRAKKELKLHTKRLSKKIEHDSTKHFSELELAQKEIIYILTDILESNSGETASHVKRVAHISKELALLDDSIDDNEVDMIFLAAPLHDIGKLLIDNEILHKPGKLTDEEFVVMMQHSDFAHDVLKKSDTKLVKTASIIAHQHHENYDGSGYPKGLKGDDIHIYGRIVAIADVLDALTHERSYKKAWTFDEAHEFILQNSSKKFDPRLVELFTENIDRFRRIIEGD